MLVGYRFKPGERLHIIGLAESLRVSSTPVREALNRLTAENLLSCVPAKGFFAKNISLQEHADLYRLYHVLMRYVIEGHADTWTTPPIVPQHPVRRMTAANTSSEGECDRESSIEQIATSIEQLFEAAVALSRNDVLIKVVRNIIDRTHYIRRIDIDMSPDRASVHGAIVELFARSRDSNRAAAIAILDDLFKRKLAIMPQLVKEGVVRIMSR
jgi:DNA-binding GntR family transcriptional regulator